MFKKILTGIMSLAIAASCVISASASTTESISPLYWENGREVQYYSFSWGNNANPLQVSTATSQKVYANRNFVISINSISNATYNVNWYLSTQNSEAYNVTQIVSKNTTGNYGAAFLSGSTMVGQNLVLCGMRDTRDLYKTVSSTGQFSSDNA